MRISDWSSDVCSSDLPRFDEPQLAVALQRFFEPSAPIGRQTEAEGLCGRRAQPAPLEIVARFAALYALQLCDEPVLRRAHDITSGGRLFCPFGCVRIGCRHFPSGTCGEFFPALPARQSALTGHPPNTVPVPPPPRTVI